jgi:hypothetical protein
MVPVTNGTVRSFGHVRLSMAGQDFTGGFKSIKFSSDREREQVYSNSPDPIGKTLGQNKYECEAVLYYDWWANFVQTVENQLGPGYADQSFTIYVSTVGTNLSTYTTQILNCTIDSSELDMQAGTGALTVSVKFSPTKVLQLGLDDLEVPLQAPPS